MKKTYKMRLIVTLETVNGEDVDIEFFVGRGKAQIREHWPDGEIRCTPLLEMGKVVSMLLAAVEKGKTSITANNKGE